MVVALPATAQEVLTRPEQPFHEMGSGCPGYNSLLPKSCGTLAEVLKQNGWNSSW